MYIFCSKRDNNKNDHLQKRRPPSFFSNLHECLKIMIRSFVQVDKEVYTSDTLKRVEYLLKIHGMETRELIHQYHLERWQEQKAIAEPKMGILTVRAQFIDDNLKVEIMNARNLVPTDSNGEYLLFKSLYIVTASAQKKLIRQDCDNALAATDICRRR